MVVAVMDARSTLADELGIIAREHGGILQAEQVVKWAEAHPGSQLYQQLEWDNVAAGHAYRVWQARRIIGRVKIRLEGLERPIESRCYVSLLQDRTQPSGGYRTAVAVLGDREMKQALLRQALAELEAWERKYKELEELAEVFAAGRRVREMV